MRVSRSRNFPREKIPYCFPCGRELLVRELSNLEPEHGGLFRTIKNRLISSARRHQVSDHFDRLNSPASSHPHAVERRSSTCEIESSPKPPVFEESVNESSVKRISTPSCVNGRNLIRTGVLELLAIPCQDSILTERRRSQSAPITPLHERQ